MIEILTISVLSLLVVILGFTTFNLLKKTEKYEDVLKLYSDILLSLSQVIDLSDKQIKELDERQTFSSDDEIGWFFDQIKHIQDTLNKFNENIKQYGKED